MKAELALYIVTDETVTCACCGVPIAPPGGRRVCISMTDRGASGDRREDWQRFEYRERIYVCVPCALESSDRDVVLLARRAEDASS